MSKYEPNNIYNVDCYEAIKEIPDGSIDLIVTDPPYEIKSLTGGGQAMVNGTLKKWCDKSAFKDLGGNQLDKGIKTEILEDFMRVMKKPNIYLWCNKSQIYDYVNFFVGKYDLNFVPIIWHKTNAMPLCGSKYLDDCEYCLYFYKGIKLNTCYDTASTVYNLPINMEDKKLYEHPTVKPIEIIKNLIINSSDEGGVILDTFLGSGTTAVACKELNRRFIGFEINKKFYDIAVDRLNGISVPERKARDKGQQNIFDFLDQ